MSRRALLWFALSVVAGTAHAQSYRVGDLTLRDGDVPVRLLGYGLVVGLDGTGDRDVGLGLGTSPTVRSVANLLRRFNVVVPPEEMHSRNVAAVLVTAEMSPYLRAGGRFEVQVASLGDATSLRGGLLWITPMVTEPDQEPVATAQGRLMVGTGNADGAPRGSLYGSRQGASGRVPDGGILEQPLAFAVPQGPPRLLLRRPDLGLASRIAESVNAAYGRSVARVEDPGLITLTPPTAGAEDLPGFLSGIDTLSVANLPPSGRILVDARSGTVVAGGDVRVGPAVVSLGNITVRIGDQPAGAVPPGTVALPRGALVQDVAQGLHSLDVTSAQIAEVFEALRSVGALTAEVVVR